MQIISNTIIFEMVMASKMSRCQIFAQDTLWASRVIEYHVPHSSFVARLMVSANQQFFEHLWGPIVMGPYNILKDGNDHLSSKILLLLLGRGVEWYLSCDL